MNVVEVLLLTTTAEPMFCPTLYVVPLVIVGMVEELSNTTKYPSAAGVVPVNEPLTEEVPVADNTTLVTELAGSVHATTVPVVKEAEKSSTANKSSEPKISTSLKRIQNVAPFGIAKPVKL